MRGLRVTAAWLLLAALSGCIQVEIGATPPPPAPEEPGASATFAWTPAEPRAGQVVTFKANVRSAEAGDGVRSVAWSFGDGTGGSGMTVQHVYRAAGEHTVRLVAETKLSGKLGARHDLTVAAPLAGSGPLTGPLSPLPPLVMSASVEGNVARFSFRFDAVPQLIAWDFGDGAASAEPAPEHTYFSKGDFVVTLRLLADGGVATNRTTVRIEAVPFQPHVIVGVPDTGINPYHHLYFRPERTAHPCTYIERFPCSVPALNLSLDEPTWDDAFRKDREIWESIRPGDVFWIPRTVFVAVLCDSPHVESDASQDLCILDDSHMHGTGTTSSVLMENPDALLAFKETGGDVRPFLDAGIPVDVFSVSWGYEAPVPALPGYSTLPALYVKSLGNSPNPSVADGWSGHPDVIGVGGAFASDRSEEPTAAKQPEVVSYYCRPTAQTKELTAMRESYCGTSFAAPTVAGALSKAILAVRRGSGYTGSGMDGGVLDPLAGLTVAGLRHAMNLTASYAPEPEYPNGGGVPLASPTPWVQWGWGFYDGTVADATIAHLLEGAAASKPAEAVAYMEAQYAAKQATHPV